MTDEQEYYGMPTGKQDPCIKAHKYASSVNEAHPIDLDCIKSECNNPLVIGYSFADIQAVADMYIDDIPNATLVDSEGDIEYYVVQSDLFYRLAMRVNEEFQNAYIEIENLQSIIDSHTIQYLSDMHDYCRNFSGQEKTLCNALNDQTPQEGTVNNNNVYMDKYCFIDSRGLIVQRGTHSDHNS